MLEFFKKIINKIFGTNFKLLEAPDYIEETDEKNQIQKEKTNIDYGNSENMFEFLTGIMESCDNYDEFVESEIRKEKVKNKMRVAKENLKKYNQ